MKFQPIQHETILARVESSDLQGVEPNLLLVWAGLLRSDLWTVQRLQDDRPDDDKLLVARARLERAIGRLESERLKAKRTGE